jgi:hypothetical protein
MQHSMEDVLPNVIKLSSAQRERVYDAADELANERGDDELKQHVAKARKHEQHTRDLERKYHGEQDSDAMYPPDMGPLDARLDRSMTGLRDMVQGAMQGDEDDEELQEKGRELLIGIYPKGVREATRQPYPEQAVTAQDIIAKLGDEYAEHVEFFGLHRKLRNMTALVTEYKDMVDRGRVTTVTAAEVKAAHRRAHRFLLEVVARVIGLTFDSDNPQHMTERAKVLDVLFAEMARTRDLRAARRRRRAAANGDDGADGGAGDGAGDAGADDSGADDSGADATANID